MPEGDRAAAIQRAEGEKAALVLAAEGRQQAALRDAEARERIEAVHTPYHQALERLLMGARSRFGTALLLDWHSMPSTAAGPASR